MWKTARLLRHSRPSKWRNIATSSPFAYSSTAMPRAVQNEERAGGSESKAVAENPTSRPSGKRRTTSKNVEGSGSFRSSVDPLEAAKFAAMAETFWDHRGPYKVLHAMNPVRLSFIRAALCRQFGKNPDSAKPLTGLRILDVGCGGGLACERLARMGAQVTGIDAVEENVRVAEAHAAKDSATASINYRHITAEQLIQETERFDVILALEIIEHVVDPKDFCASLAALVNKDGVVVVSTINRTVRSYLLAIGAGEYVLRWVPRGTHDWSKFVTPEELALLMNQSSLGMEEMAGMVYNPVSLNWYLSEDINVNYIAYGIKTAP